VRLSIRRATRRGSIRGGVPGQQRPAAASLRAAPEGEAVTRRTATFRCVHGVQWDLSLWVRYLP
jgi:hypothetical protein